MLIPLSGKSVNGKNAPRERTMCELLALSSRWPTAVTLSLSAFAEHRGSADGWGVAFYDAGDVRLYKEPEFAAESAWLASIRQRQLTSPLILAHIRHATRGGRTLANTQPFTRELGGRMHAFAHNGRLDSIDRDHAGGWKRYRPVGETDSEIAFCILLERMAPLWENEAMPALDARLSVFTQFAVDMRVMGPANFLYSDGDALFVHGHRRMQADGKIAPPGLWRLCRQCDRDSMAAVSDMAIAANGRKQDVVLFASVPLSKEHWQPLKEGEVLVARNGNLLARATDAGTRAGLVPDMPSQSTVQMHG